MSAFEVDNLNRINKKQLTPEEVKKTKRAVRNIVIAVILFFIPVLCIRSVGAGQVGVITRFGDVDRTADSGIAFKLPWPIERIKKLDTRVQKEEIDSEAATADLQDVNAKLALNYSLDRDTALKVFKEIGVDYKSNIVIPALQESFKASTSRFTAQELITKRAEVKKVAFDAVKERIGKYGITVIDLNIVNFSFSEEFSKAIEATQVANQNVAKARQELETTKVEAEKKVAAAQADAEAQRLQQQTLTPELLQKYAIDKWNGVLPTTNAGGGNIFSIPIR